jgi:dTMP kinase
VREGYLILAKGMPERLIVIDGADKETNIQKAIWDAVKTRLNGSLGSPPKKKVPARKPAKSAARKKR